MVRLPVGLVSLVDLPAVRLADLVDLVDQPTADPSAIDFTICLIDLLAVVLTIDLVDLPVMSRSTVEIVSAVR